MPPRLKKQSGEKKSSFDRKPGHPETIQELEYWEVLHTRTFSFETCISLEEMSSRLLATKACSNIICSAGWYCHLKDGQPVYDTLDIQAKPFADKGKVTLGEVEDDFTRVTLLMSVESLYTEQKFFSAEALQSAKYIRCVFDPFYVEFSGKIIALYPNAKIYENGICTISLRILSGSQIQSLDEVADSVLGISRQYFECVYTPSLIQERATATDVVSSFLKLNKGIHLTHSPESVGSVLLGSVLTNSELGRETLYRKSEFHQIDGFAMLDYVWDTLQSYLDDVAFRPTKLNLRALKLRHSSRSHRWFGHPIVFILKWQDQPTKASEIDLADKSVARLLAGRSDITPEAYSIVAQPMPRLFEDYRFFMTEGSSVYFASQQLIDNANKADSHFQRVTHSLLANEELALWMIASFQSLALRCKAARSAQDIRELRRVFHDLESIRLRVSPYHELELLFTEYLTRFRINTDIQSITNSLDQLDKELKDTTNLRIAALGLIATIVFGLLGSAQIAEWIFRPLRAAGGKLPTIGRLPQDTSDFVLAGFALLVSFGVSWLIVLKRTKK